MSELADGVVPAPRSPEDDRLACRRRLVAGTRRFLLDDDPELEWADANNRALALVDLVAREVPGAVSL